MMENCGVCGVKANQKCTGCNSVVYCSREHQVADWKNGHKKICKCYDIKSNDTLGRFMIASRDIKPGEVILREKPCVIGPKTVSQVLCLGCHRQLPSITYNCSKCTWPLCGKPCESSSYHVDECRIMSARNFKCSIKSAEKIESCYCVITPLRILLMRKSSLFEEFSKLESHLKERKSTKLYEMLRVNLVPFIVNFLQLPNTSEEDILTIAGIFDTNCFEVFLSSKLIRVRGIYLKSAMMAHDCRPNTKHCFEDNLDMKVIATTSIKKGEMILTSYAHPLKTTIERRLGIKQSKCFDCLCSRCKDSSEMKTFASSLKCSTCDGGVLTSSNSLENLADWKCLKCENTLHASKILPIFANVRSRLESLDKKSVEKCEKFLEDHESLLPPSSVFMVDVKYALCMLYGNIPGFYYNQLSTSQIQRKLNLCLEMTQTLANFEPGISNSVLNCQFEMMAAKMVLTKNEEDIEGHMTEMKKIYNLLMSSSENKTLLQNRLKRVKEICNVPLDLK